MICVFIWFTVLAIEWVTCKLCRQLVRKNSSSFSSPLTKVMFTLFDYCSYLPPLQMVILIAVKAQSPFGMASQPLWLMCLDKLKLGGNHLQQPWALKRLVPEHFKGLRLPRFSFCVVSRLQMASPSELAWRGATAVHSPGSGRACPTCTGADADWCCFPLGHLPRLWQLPTIFFQS